MFESIIFSILSAGIIILSWSSLRNPRSHGFYRFFAFELLAALFVLNLDGWFHDPFSDHQLISWILLLASLSVAVQGFRLLVLVGAPVGDIENTTGLIQVGLYRHIRHPLYSSLLLLGWGMFFKHPSWENGILALTTSVVIYLTAIVEERENLQQFGQPYADYMKTTRRFIPFIF